MYQDKDFNLRSPCGERRGMRRYLAVFNAISIHAPRVGSDPQIQQDSQAQAPFQSTLPVWGATASKRLKKSALPISIHAPRVGSDNALAETQKINSKFQSTLPVWGATTLPGQCRSGHRISIHAPRVGSDLLLAHRKTCAGQISIHAPRVGSDNEYKAHIFRGRTFQSTLPVWGATWSLN